MQRAERATLEQMEKLKSPVNTVEDTGAGDESTDENVDSDDTNSEDENENRPETIVLTYNDGENDKSIEAELTESDEQDYSLYVLPLYKLTSEEPGRDILYVNDENRLHFHAN